MHVYVNVYDVLSSCTFPWTIWLLNVLIFVFPKGIKYQSIVLLCMIWCNPINMYLYIYYVLSSCAFTWTIYLLNVLMFAFLKVKIDSSRRFARLTGTF